MLSLLVKERLLSADNIVFNGSGEDLEFNDVGQLKVDDGVFDVDLYITMQS